MVRTEKFAVDLYGGYTDTKILKQNDDTVLEISVNANREPFEFSNVKIAAQLADGTVIIQSKNIEIDGSRAVITLDRRIVDEPGNIRFELIFYNGSGNQISTYVFGAIVEARLIQKYNPEIPPDMSDYVRKNEPGNANEIWFGDGESFQEKFDAGDLTGADGKDGVDGKDGTNGIDGKDGTDGVDGIDGTPGKDGTDGKDGSDGAPGTAGKDGSDGKDGTDGADGADAPPTLDGETDPTDETIGEFGQHYINTATGGVFVCVNNIAPYVWEEQNKDWKNDISEMIEAAIGEVLDGEF